MSAALEVSNLRVRYGAIEAINDLNLSVLEGEVVAVIGANGAGKSSLLNAIAGLVRVASATISVGGAEISG